MADAAPAALGVYKPRRPRAWPLFRLVSDHMQQLQTVYDERFAREYGLWRPVVAQVTNKFLAWGILEHGFARIRCDDCAHEHLLAFSCKGRYFCPSCHAKRLAIWTCWLDTTAPGTRDTRRGATTPCSDDRTAREAGCRAADLSSGRPTRASATRPGAAWDLTILPLTPIEFAIP